MFQEMALAAAAVSLIGRDEVLARIDEFLAAENGATSVLVLEGEPGIGKTTLWRRGAERARELGFQVLQARPAASERELSFAALGDLVMPLRDEIGHLPAPLRRALRIALLLEEAEGQPPDQRTIAVALTELLRRVARESALLVALDDAQWLDAVSSAAIEFAVRRSRDAGVRVLATARSGDDVPVSFHDAELLTVGPLPVDALDRIIRDRLGAQFRAPTLRRIREVSGGNAFYALEIADSLLRNGAQPEPGEPLPIPPRLNDVVAERLTGLTAAGRQAALVTAALARPTEALVASTIEGGTDAIADAVDAGILRSDRSLLSFSHPLVATVVYEAAAPPDRRRVHRMLGALVDNPEERARHLAEAADGPDDEVAAALDVAARSVTSRGAHDVAARLAKRALELTPVANRRDHHRRLLALARVSVAAGDVPHAERLLEEEDGIFASATERAETQLELGRVCAMRGSFTPARAAFERGLRQIERAEEPELRARLLIELAELALYTRQPDGDASSEAVVLAETIGDGDLLAHALGVHGSTQTLLGNSPSEDYWQRAIELERATGTIRWGGPTLAFATALFERGEFGTVFELTNVALAAMRARGDPMVVHVLIDLAELARVAGDWDGANRYLDEAHELVVQTGRERVEPLVLLWKARIALPRGELDVARGFVADAADLAERLQLCDGDERDPTGLIDSLLGQIAATTGDDAVAHEHFVRSTVAFEDAGPLAASALSENLAADAVSLVALGRLDEAKRRVARLVDLVSALDMPDLDGFVLRTRGLVAAAEGKVDIGVRHLEAAVDCFAALTSPWPFQHAVTLFMLGTVQRRSRRKLAARNALDAALEIFERLGARIWAEKTRAEIAQISGRPVRSSGLTETERRVAELVARGRSNAEVARELSMSPKTVEWNLSKIYKKLHVRSRAELAAKLAKPPVSP